MISNSNHLKNLYLSFKQRKEEKKLNSEIPKLINFLVAYINAGLHPSQALEQITQKVNFSKLIRFPLFKVTTLCSRGCSFVESIDITLKDINTLPSRKYLSLLLIGLKISFLKGSGSVTILEKIKEKVENEIQFQQKLHVLTAQMRLQAIIILFSPLILGFLIFLIAPAHIYIFFESFFGNCLLVLMIVFNLCGYFVLKKLMKIE